MRRAIIGLGLFLAGCAGDETLHGYGAAGGSWRLAEVDGLDADGPLSLQFPAPGRVTGQGPCNRFTGAQTAPYPWFDLTGPAMTRRACPELAAEARLVAALQAMTLAEVAGDLLILSNPEGAEMVFTRVPGG
ncbi:META domain-containing protein [Aestuariicoccus sp. MJ-SS9]|uniref:META domain-containing protein n=1 Tax=Aestuariicoccus sp. MJ-SS9 TaxID=3079855 RepID=UPI00290D53ED|nr:META domain-containing protein [Aestuariicoccus sp. MJ-SS9]MDU8912600.1 META domain-containing protein [Aestuariicoccus sp. MJ-SS9]